jgi:hypothetical protein
MLLFVEIDLGLSGKRVNALLYGVEGIGGIFVAIFLAAYLAGLPTTNVLHSEPTVRMALLVVGVVFLASILITIVVAAYRKSTTAP